MYIPLENHQRATVKNNALVRLETARKDSHKFLQTVEFEFVGKPLVVKCERCKTPGVVALCAACERFLRGQELRKKIASGNPQNQNLLLRCAVLLFIAATVGSYLFYTFF